jgi:fatty acid desaturase
VTPFPTPRRSLARKIARDLTGATGVRRVIGLLLMDLGLMPYTASGDVGRARASSDSDVRDPDSAEARRSRGRARRLLAAVRAGAVNLGPVALTNAALYAALAAVGHGALYLLWVAAYFTTFSLFLRVRSLAEHACTADSADPFANTRTTRASWLARLTVAPHHVNYHLEHHLLMTAPHYRLPALRRLLRDRGALEQTPASPSYLDVLRQVSAARA